MPQAVPFAEEQLPDGQPSCSFSWHLGPDSALAVTVEPQEVPEGATVTFDYGDGSGPVADTTHTYPEAGSYLVTMVATLSDDRYVMAANQVTVKLFYLDENANLVVGVSTDWLHTVPLVEVSAELPESIT